MADANFEIQSVLSELPENEQEFVLDIARYLKDRIEHPKRYHSKVSRGRPVVSEYDQDAKYKIPMPAAVERSYLYYQLAPENRKSFENFVQFLTEQNDRKNSLNSP
ncbi:MAG: hypothetical protein RBT34_06635 [Anaerolineaceae bacterium]|jgi:mRNA-degrading endonuclease RelE of RelBE toxin-antitoxin system|nr:hypothetical protein [Anaerolineaceae bacterium]MDY0280595.1 hypothetical protein [Salinivirgaceae bacterium]